MAKSTRISIRLTPGPRAVLSIAGWFAIAVPGLAPAETADPPQGCRVVTSAQLRELRSVSPLSSTTLPVGTRGWECIPNVIRSDGVETFRVEVDVNGSVQGVRLSNIPPYLLAPVAQPVALHDDGLGEDRQAGDGIWTGEGFRYNTGLPLPSHYEGDVSSPAGLYFTGLGTLVVEENGGATTQFLLGPTVGLLRPDVPVAPIILDLAPDLAVSRHLVNLRSEDHVTQRVMRFLGADVATLTRRVYAALPDVFDFLCFFSAEKIEWTPRTNSNNFVAGLHAQAQTDFTGTGLVPYDDSAFYGSGGRLLGINLLDSDRRGIVGNNVTHELTHQWAAYTSTALSDGSGHYDYRTSVGSLVGGFAWADQGDGTFIRNCDEGRNGAHHAPPLDLYLMGVLADTSVIALHRSELPGSPLCDQLIDTVTTTTIAEIQAVHGPRVPDPASARRDFAMAFVIETHGRLLNPTERTFYDRLAEHYTSPLPPAAPDPYMGFNWPTIVRFFPGTTWSSDILMLASGVPPDGPRSARLRLAPPVPNPSASRTRIAWEVSAGSPAIATRLEVLDLQGRRLRTLVSGPLAPGRHEATWDGRDGGGRLAPAGVYVVRLVCGGEIAVQRVVRLAATGGS